MTCRATTCLTALAVFAGTWGCAASHPAVRAAPYRIAMHAGPTAEELALVETHCPAGAPRLLESIAHGPTVLVARKGYVLSHSSVDRIPRWVCEKVTWAQLQGDLDRSDAFRADPALKPSERAELADYKGSGFDRGHMAPAANQMVDSVLKDETFFLSNMAPQVGRQFNQGAWRILEEWARDRVTKDSPVHVITGGFFHDPQEDEPATADGTIPYRTIGKGAVAVPTHFFKIVARQDAAGEWEAIAFVMENRPYQDSKAYRTSIQSVRWIEQRAAIDFFPDLDAVSQDRIEQDRPPLWP